MLTCPLSPQEVRSTTTVYLLLKIATLKIRMVSKKEVFEANLKRECDLWHLMVKEMWAGRKLADSHKVRGARPPHPRPARHACGPETTLGPAVGLTQTRP